MEKREASKPRVKKGLWKPEEDLILKTYVETHGEGNWATVSANSGLKRGGKSCRLRWKNYLRPNIKRGGISEEEEDLIIRMHKLLGNRWSLIAGRLPGRTDNEVKNYWNTHLNKKCHSGKRKSPIEDCSNSDCKNRKKRKCTQKSDDDQKEEQEESTYVIAATATASSIDHTWIQEAKGMNYYIESPVWVPVANSSAAFVYDDIAFTAGHFDSFVLFDSFGFGTEQETFSFMGI